MFALFDTGAKCSVIQRKTLQQLPAVVIDKTDVADITTFQGLRVNVFGSVNLTVQLAHEEPKEWPFLVVDEKHPAQVVFG